MPSIAVTGLGIISPVGNDVPSFWRNLCAGVSGISELRGFDTDGFAFTRGGEVRDFRMPGRLAAAADGLDRATCYLLAAVEEAIAQAGLAEGGIDPGRIAVVTASNFGGSESGEAIFSQVARKGAAQVGDWQRYQFQSGADAVARVRGFLGPRITLSLSCSSGTATLAVAADLIRSGEAKVVIAAGYDALSRYAWLGLSALRTITSEEIRPFDADRSGTIFSEGAGVLVLEDTDFAIERGGKPLAEILGAATNNNAFHITAPAKRGAGSAAAMAAALSDAGLDPSEIDHINTHGTGTVANDVTETEAIKTVFGDRAVKIPATSIKSSIGHMLGAAGSAEAIASVMSLIKGVIPPTINYRNPDPACDLDLVVGNARPASIHRALSNSAGIGGCNAVAIFGSYPPGDGPRSRGKSITVQSSARPGVRRVAVTGVGPVSPIGIGREDYQEGLQIGDDGVSDLTLFDHPDLTGLLVGEMPDFVLKDYFAKPKGYLDRSTQLAFAAAALALEDAGLATDAMGGSRHGIALGTAAGCSETAGRFFADFLNKGPRFVKPILFPHTYFNTTISMLAIEYGLAGPHLAFASGLVSGAQAIHAACEQIRLNRADIMLAGGVDALSLEWLLGWKLQGWLTPGPDGGLPICAPFDTDHNGTVLGEGASILVLEEYEHAVARCATIQAVVDGFGECSDSEPTGAAMCRAIKRCLTSGSDVDLVLSGANGQPRIDTAEAEGIAVAFHSGRGNEAPPVTAVKSLFGEAGGAAAGLQIAAGLFAARGLLPPTLNLRNPQPEAVFNVPEDTGVTGNVRSFMVTDTDPGGTAAAIRFAIP